MLSFINNTIKFGIRVSRKAKIHKQKYYGGIPHFIKPYFIDIHDTYKLRTIQQVKQQIKDQQFKIKMQLQIYNPNDLRSQVKSRKAAINFEINQFNFTELQLERFKLLMDKRYDQQNQIGRIVCQMFPKYQANLNKAIQQLRDIIYESKRAP